MGRMLLLLGVLTLSGGAFSAHCSPSERATNLARCLEDIQVRMVNTSAFWFGTDYQTRCPTGPAGGILCSNMHPNKADSLASRLFPNGLDFDMMDKYLDVTFTSEPGTYSGCGHTVVTNTTWTKSLNPTSDEWVYPWHVRHTPEMTWETDPNTLYTIVVYDAGNFILHGLYININGTDIANSEAVDAYHGPLAASNMANVYAFLLFEQNDTLTIPQNWMTRINGGWGVDPFTVDGFANDMNLKGPVAANWLTAKGDIYAAGTMLSRGIHNMCPIHIGNALDMKPRPFLPNPVHLTVSVDLTFQSPIMMYSTCCRMIQSPAKTFSTDPIGNPVFTTAETRSESRLSVTLMKLDLFMVANNFTGDMYTLVALDPDVPSPSAGTEDKPILHMMVVNIMDGNVSTGDAVQPYSGPTPPDNNPHWYTFLLYKQEDTLNGTAMLGYAERPTRFLFNINKMVSENNLTLVGANWFRAARDDYVTYRYVQRTNNQTEIDELCRGYPEYMNPCQTSGAGVLSFSIMTFVVVAFSGAIYNL